MISLTGINTKLRGRHGSSRCSPVGSPLVYPLDPTLPRCCRLPRTPQARRPYYITRSGRTAAAALGSFCNDGDSARMESIVQPEILKQGVLGKLGGGAGGHKNWKDRYFVLSDHLYYFASKEVRRGHVPRAWPSGARPTGVSTIPSRRWRL
jgi:hypothetical protein